MDKIVSKAKAKSRLRTNEIQLKVAKLQDGEVPVSPVPNQKEGEVPKFLDALSRASPPHSFRLTINPAESVANGRSTYVSRLECFN